MDLSAAALREAGDCEAAFHAEEQDPQSML